ncbi:GNAT family N-acetyltransferase [Nocardioides caldifontis]|uniref:GNAT family N-acetyltransferase n=1 Tax=Nocardioides caldifontis TaxID=2588938 RepID=UPI0011DF1402|nr:GNAT family N-acetyltransferase [Nocardioides caldifontis]
MTVTPALPTLPAGLTARPLTLADTAEVTRVMAAEQLHDLGSVEIEEADIIGDWQRPGFDVEASTMGVFHVEHGAEKLVAYVELTDPYRGDAAVDPAYHGRGIGTALNQWLVELARSRGSEVVGMPVPEGSPGDRLLASLGWFVRWTSWVLQLPEGKEILAQPLPAGYEIRTAESEEDRRAVFSVIEDAFLEWSERERRSFEEFLAVSVQRPGFEPWNLRVLVDPDGAAVGGCYLQMAAPEDAALTGPVGYVHSLAVRRDQRGLGLARALLADAFRGAREHGAIRSELATDSRTGALGLYEKVGMEVTSTWVHRATRL